MRALPQSDKRMTIFEELLRNAEADFAAIQRPPIAIAKIDFRKERLSREPRHLVKRSDHPQPSVSLSAAKRGRGPGRGGASGFRGRSFDFYPEIHFGNHSNSSISHESVFSFHGDCIHSISVKFAILKGLKSLSPALRGMSYAGCPVAETPNPERVESQSIQFHKYR